MSKKNIKYFAALILIALLAGCSLNSVVVVNSSTGGSGNSAPPITITADETGRVVRVIDGDTIDVSINGQTERIRYIGMNTPERTEPCYQDATDANAALVSGQTVSLVKDVSETDQYGRLLRFVYVGGTFVNAQLVRAGWAEAVLYPPDDAHHDEFVQLEQAAATANIGCHPTGIFNDGSTTR